MSGCFCVSRPNPPSKKGKEKTSEDRPQESIQGERPNGNPEKSGKDRHKGDREDWNGPGEKDTQCFFLSTETFLQIFYLIPIHTQKTLEPDDQCLPSVITDEIPDIGAQRGSDRPRKDNDPQNLGEGIGNRKSGWDQDCPSAHDDQWGRDGDDDLLDHHPDEDGELTMSPHQLHNPLRDVCDQDRLPFDAGFAKPMGYGPPLVSSYLLIP